MNLNSVPRYEIITYEINPKVGENRFGAKAIVPSDYNVESEDPFGKEFWGKTEEEAIGKVKEAIKRWAEKSGI